MGVVPVVHVVLFGQPRRPRIPDVVLAQEVLHVRRRLAVDEIPSPDFGLVRAPRMPDGEGARLSRMERRVGKDFPGASGHASPFTPAAPPLRLALLEELGHHGDRKSTRLNSSHGYISYAVFCLK